MKSNKLTLKLILFMILILFLFFICSCNKNNETVQIDDKNFVDNSILYNNAYEYTSNKINFLLKERGYDLTENYNSQIIEISKKELLIIFNTDDKLSETLDYELYQEDNLIIKGILYNNEDYYYSNIILNNVNEFSNNLKIKILSEEKVLYDFNLKEVET